MHAPSEHAPRKGVQVACTTAPFHTTLLLLPMTHQMNQKMRENFNRNQEDPECLWRPGQTTACLLTLPTHMPDTSRTTNTHARERHWVWPERPETPAVLFYGVLSDRHSVDATAAAAAVLPRDQLALTAVDCWRPFAAFGYSHEANATDGNRVSERENRIRQHWGDSFICRWWRGGMKMKICWREVKRRYSRWSMGDMSVYDCWWWWHLFASSTWSKAFDCLVLFADSADLNNICANWLPFSSLEFL